MKRVFLLSVAVVTVLASPGAVPASHGIADAECTGQTFADSESSWFGECVVGFELASGAEISDLETHGNFHDLTLTEDTRIVQLFWHDALGRTVTVIDCRTTGASIPRDEDYPLPVEGLGPLDVGSFTCDRQDLMPSYEPGPQTLSVAATSSVDTTGLLFHGRLVFTMGSPSGYA